MKSGCVRVGTSFTHWWLLSAHLSMLGLKTSYQ
jgi:hypothetical protein